MADLVIRGVAPVGALIDAIYATADLLDVWECFAVEGRYHFPLGSGWSLALSADSGDRIRLDACRLSQPVSTMWTPAHRKDRLAGLVRLMRPVPEAV